MPNEVYVLHPLPDRHVHRFDQNNRNGTTLHKISNNFSIKLSNY